MEGTAAGENGKISGGGSVTEGERHYYKTASERDAQSVERHPLITERRDQGDEGSVETHGLGRRHGPDSSKDETARSGYERAWHALSGYERAPSPTSMYDGAPHPISDYERLPVDRAHTMKDFEKQITDLKKENFNLKLRIYFLEEQVQRQYETSSDELHRMNIELKVEVESLKHDFQEKHNLLVRASKAMEGLAGEHDLTVQRLQEEHLRRLQDMEGAHSHAVHLLENQIQHEKAELEKMCVLLDQERMQWFTTEERLLSVNEQYTKSMKILEERDWIIQCLNETVHSKDALIAQLEKQIASMMKSEASSDQPGKNASNLYRESEGLLEPTCNGDRVDGKEENVNEWQRKVKEMGNLINELQQKLEANKAGFAAEEKNSIKRDKAIQGLTLALKKKTKENDKLLNEIDNLNATLAKARDVAQEVQLQSVKENVHPDYKKLIFTLQAEQDMYSRLLKYERESGGLQKEREAIAMLQRWLEENIQANQELRKIMEAQIMAKYKGDDSMSFLGDQTSYLSICLDPLDQNEYYFARGLYGRDISKNIDILREEAGTQTQSEVSALAGESSKHHLDYKSDLSLNERSTIKGESGGNDGTPIKNRQHTVSSATQTDPGAFIEKCIAVNVNSFPKDNSELLWTLQDGELNLLSQRLPQKLSYSPCEINRHKQGEVYNLTQNAKKSRLPVLVKSSLNTKPKTQVALTPANENDQSCPEELQMENRKRKKMKVEAYNENRDLVNENAILDRNNPGQEQRDPAETAEHTDLMRAECEITTLKEKREMLKCMESELHNSKQRESTEEAFKELQAENYRLSKELTQAEKKIETLEANDGFKREDPVPDVSISNKVHMESTDQELQEENYRLSEQLKLAQIEIKTLKANENLIKHKDPVYDVSSSNQVHVESIDLALQKELNVENHSLSEHLEKAKIKIETIKASEELWRCKSSERDLNGSTDEQGRSPEQTLQKEPPVEIFQRSEQLKRAQVKTLAANELREHTDAVPKLAHSFKDQMEFTDQTLQKELQAENHWLSEQLKNAQMEIKKLKADAALISSKDIVPDTSGFKVQLESTDQSLEKELQAENYRLSEQLKQAQMKINQLQEEQRSTGSSNDSLKLHGSDADDDLSEQSFLDKTITNSVNVSKVDATSDFGDEVCRPNVHSQNAVALRCHHDNHCGECANNRGILSLPTSDSKRASTMHTSPQFSKVSSGRSFEDTTSLSKYNLLVQSQARELSLQRQKIKESHNLSVVCSKNFYNILNTFENLIPASALDSNITLGFQEQITQTVDWLKELEYKLSDALYGEEDAYSDHSVDSLLHTPSRLVPGHRMWADKHGCHVLGLVEDYNALRKQILEARNVLQEMEALIDVGVETAVLNMTEHFGNIFFEKLTKTKQSLEDAGCLMKLLWRVSLPIQIHSPYSINQEEEANLEIIRLRKRVLEQEKLLSGMVKRVYSENQMKEDIEKLILNQLAMTHDILKRAKGNLEVQVVDKHH
ncbi:CDK5 regulatory subunit-associated protein 2-like [Bufo gargarizans]|uniref:CDK5 regulatory subunit-associated protein 2-like n=1 Tax=Bufo gargarizans TaxID=30331 RepID=UPI001CF3D243|nr:CDK5 regulatory subunit-associated protein 2-like [Bufo gargarizans]